MYFKLYVPTADQISSIKPEQAIRNLSLTRAARVVGVVDISRSSYVSIFCQKVELSWSKDINSWTYGDGP